MTDPKLKNNATAVVLLFLFGCMIGGIAGLVYFGDRIIMYSSDSGLTGGAIGCGIFAATALYGFVKVFLARTN
jgi:hypothetical protein